MFGSAIVPLALALMTWCFRFGVLHMDLFNLLYLYPKQ